MFQIELENIGKKFKNEWIFRNLNFSFQSGIAYAITGPNGSGKSTFVQAMAGIIPVNEGRVTYKDNHRVVPEEEWYRRLSTASPYMELIEEFTLKEAVDFHSRFKTFRLNLSTDDFLEEIHLRKHALKQLKNFSSGMKQRLKLGLAFYSEAEILFLDEPTSNLDHAGFDWYLKLVENHADGRIIIVSSNEPKEYDFCTQSLNVLDFKS